TGGNMDIGISQTSIGGSGIDVDFILYGPYSNLAQAMSYCGNHGNASTAADPNQIVDCSYSPSPTETANITGAVAGQVYVMLLTNYSNQAGNITFSQTGGTASTNCAIVGPQPCPTVGIHMEDGTVSSPDYPFPATFSCA